MGYEIFTGQTLESLVGEHKDRFRTGFFEAGPLIVVQSQSLAHWLKLYLARSTGGWATGELVFQDEALRRLIAGHADSSRRPLFFDDLKWELYRLLVPVLTPPIDPVFQTLVGPGGPPDAVRVFELADQLAGIFHNYSMNSHLWPQALRTGHWPAQAGDADQRHFLWQSKLWNQLLSSGSSTLAGLVLEELTAAVPSTSEPPQTLLVIGSAFLSRRAAAFLRAWAEAGRIDVVHLLLLPAQHPCQTPWPPSRPWSSWGAFGKAFVGTLPPPTAVETNVDRSKTALGLLQSSLATCQPFPGCDPDSSFEILSCSHPFRELEAVRDRILTALAQDPTLEVHEIAVLAPDMNRYAPFLDAAFSSDDPGRNLRFHVIDLDLARESPWLRALDALLALVSGQIDRPHLFALIDTPAFRTQWELDDEERELWVQYTEEVSAWRETAGEPSQSWSASWDRLFAGWFGASRPESGAPPLEVSANAFRSLGRFYSLLETLSERSRGTFSRSFLEWVRFLEQLILEFLDSRDGTGSVLTSRLRTLALDSGSPADLIPWNGFRAFVQDQIAHFPGRRGQLLTEGVHCSSLRPLRAIPFRVVAILGLDEGAFPRAAPLPSFDLARLDPARDEVSSVSLDRYTFWETLMAAGSHLILSFQGKSAVDGSPRPPCSVLADVLDFVEEAGRPWPVTQVSVKDFSTIVSGASTWSARTFRRTISARAALERTQPQAHPPTVDLDSLFPEVRSSDVALAFTRPARFHLQRVFQIKLLKEDRRGIDDQEPWSLGFLDRQAWLRQGFQRYWSGHANPWNVEQFLSLSLATGKVRPGVFVVRDHHQLTLAAQNALRWTRDLESEGWRPLESTTGRRRFWAGHPWASDREERLVRGVEVLTPRLLYTQNLATRGAIEAAVIQLQDPYPVAQLATLSPSGEALRGQWHLDPEATKNLAGVAERYWTSAAAQLQPFYPDFLESLAKRRAKTDEPWMVSVEQAWQAARAATRTISEASLARDPYADLSLPEAPADLADRIKLWWEPLFLPLLEAWQWP